MTASLLPGTRPSPTSAASGDIRPGPSTGAASVDTDSRPAPATGWRQQRTARPARQRPGPRILLLLGLSCAGIAAAGLGGYRLGFRKGLVTGRERTEQVQGPDGTVAVVSPSTGENAPPALTGRITWVAQSGKSTPDRGARVLVLPVHRTGTALVSEVGFRPTDSATDLELAIASCRALGGNLAVAADDGAFSLHLPAAGEYQLVALSNAQTRDPDQETENLRHFLELYFHRPDRLLGQSAYQEAFLHYRGTGTEVRDYAFHEQ